VFLCFFMEALSGVKVYTHKVGRVVDVTTGKGMPDVAVIAVAKSGGINYLGGSGQNTLYRYITYTDANGDYAIPSMWSHLTTWLPFFNDIQVGWNLTTLKPGYAIVGDEKAWDFHEYDQGYAAPSQRDSPSATWLGIVVRVAPIRMNPVELSLKAASLYYREMIIADAQYMDSPEERALRKPTYENLTQRVCAEGPNAEIDNWTAEGLAILVPNKSQFDKKLKELGIGPSDWGGNAKFRAQDFCVAMKASGEGS
jgi:hypothetical protein